jgi:hypothetical protein
MITIYTVYNEKYAGYADMWIHCIKQAYPSYQVIAKEMRSHYQYDASCIRYLDRPYHEGDVYISDIDIMILKETQPLHAFHQIEMINSGLCYSNSPRNNNEPRSYERLTGLHYATQAWYAATALARLKYKNMLDRGEIGMDFFDDEIMLKKICEESGLGIPPKTPLFRRHHGIHFGTIRHYISLGPERLTSELRTRVKPDQARQWVEIMDSPEYPKIISKISNPIIRKEFEIMETFTRSWSKN